MSFGGYEYDFPEPSVQSHRPLVWRVVYFDLLGFLLAPALNPSAMVPLRRQAARAYHSFSASISWTSPTSVPVYDGAANKVIPNYLCL